MRIIVLFFIIIVLCACSSSLYHVVNENSIEDASRSENMGKLIFLSEEVVPNSDRFVKLLNMKNWPAVKAEQRLIEDEGTLNFTQAICFLLKKEYKSSYIKLNQLPDTSFQCQVLILKTDCLKELFIDSIDYHKQYQKAVDCSSDPKIRQIANTRYRFYKYGY